VIPCTLRVPASGFQPATPVAGFRFAVLRATPPCTVAATASLRSGLQRACILPARFRLPVLGPLSFSPPILSDSRIILHPLPKPVTSSSLRYPSHPLETTLDTFFVLRQKSAVFSACCAVSRALHLSKVLLSQLGFHRVHIPSYALPPPQPVRASVYRSSVSLCIYVGGFPPPRRSGLRCRSALRPRSRLGIPSRLRRSGGRHRFSPPTSSFIHARGRRGNPKDPALSCRRQPPRASRPGTLHALLPLIACYCRGSSHRTRFAVTVAAGERGTGKRVPSFSLVMPTHPIIDVMSE
jgi:hypothetical protein